VGPVVTRRSLLSAAVLDEVKVDAGCLEDYQTGKSMSAFTQVILEWDYSPADFFEEEVTWETSDYRVSIRNGKAEAEVAPSVCETHTALAQDVYSRIANRFLANQLFDRRPFKLSQRPTIVTIEADGKRGVTIQVIVSDAIVLTGQLDVAVTDADGRIIQDTRQARLQQKQHLYWLVDKCAPNDRTLAAMLRSYQAAIDDPDNFLIHLFEICDALETRFDRKKIAQKQIGISEDGWNKLARLANSEPLREGRHRGEFLGNLRNATKEEMDLGYSLGREFIEKYIRYLEQLNQ
jgi:hypothetical protein